MPNFGKGYKWKLVEVNSFVMHNDVLLKCVYDVKDTNGNIDRVVLSNIVLPIRDMPILDISFHNYVEHDTTVNLGFGEIDANTMLMTETRIKDAVKEMSLTEIEKILGHKIKIVNKED